MLLFRSVLIIIISVFTGLVCGQSFKAADTLESIYNTSGCGINYTQASVVLGQKMVYNGLPFPGTVQPADFVIAPDVKAFDITEFSRADEMAAIGEQAMRESIPQIKQLLAKIDPKLFAQNDDDCE